MRVCPSLTDYTEIYAAQPPEPVAVDWEVVEEWLGVRLPGDYRRLAGECGPVEVGGFLNVHVPCGDGDAYDWSRWLRRVLRDARGEAGCPVLYPEPGGLLPWGDSEDGDLFFWDTSRSEDPDAWPVVVLHRGAIPGSGLLPWHRYEVGLGAYLRYTVREGWETPTPPGPVIGPLYGSRARPDFLADSPVPWVPPVPVPPRLGEEERRLALETGTGLDALRLLAPPPVEPYLGGGDWDGLFAELGTRLPTEYMAMMDLYGAGIWSEWLRFHTPLRTGERRFVTHVEETLEGYRSLRESHPDDFPLPAWPEPGGFLPFANSIDADYLGWLTKGPDPDAWPLVLWPRHAQQGPPLEGGLLDTLLAWQRGALVTPGLVRLDEEDDDPLEFAGFRSWDDRAYW
ncbi:hypothetical protein ACIQ6Y_28465 [Streptomyces sp. NPDC096205]|uniref:hypothetical protein n=1 Tax=Streptomyces sp. NPDC096205 TaxID=3366081 RepID=UPI0038140CF3